MAQVPQIVLQKPTADTGVEVKADDKGWVAKHLDEDKTELLVEYNEGHGGFLRFLSGAGYDVYGNAIETKGFNPAAATAGAYSNFANNNSRIYFLSAGPSGTILHFEALENDFVDQVTYYSTGIGDNVDIALYELDPSTNQPRKKAFDTAILSTVNGGYESKTVDWKLTPGKKYGLAIVGDITNWKAADQAGGMLYYAAGAGQTAPANLAGAGTAVNKLIAVSCRFKTRNF